MLNESSTSSIKIAVLNLILNLIWKDGDGNSENKIVKKIQEMVLLENLEQMRENEQDIETRTFFARVINKLN